MKKEIVIVCDYGYYEGGAAKIAIQTAIGLSKFGYNVTYFCGVGPIEMELEKNVSRVVCLNQYDILNNPSRIKAICQGFYNVQACNELKRIVSKDTVVHIHSWTKALSSSVFNACNDVKCKTFLTLHDYFLLCPNGGFYNYKKKTICKIKPTSLKCFLCNCDSRNYLQKIWRFLRQLIQNRNIRRFKELNFFYISNFQKQVLSKYINTNKMICLPNPIETYEGINLDFSKNEFCIFIGRLSTEKGCDLFCKAITELGLKGRVIGDGPLKNELSKEYKNIEFTGWKNKDEIYEYMKNAKCLILPSICYETDSLVTHEACGIGLPCIVPDESAASDQIVNDKNGYLFKTGNLDDLKNKIALINTKKIEFYKVKQNDLNDYCKMIIEKMCLDV